MNVSKTIFVFLVVILQSFVVNGLFCHPIDEIGELLKKGNIKAINESKVYEGDRLYEFIDGGADIYFEYGFEKVMTQKVSYNKLAFDISIYEMKSADAAYGIFTFNRYEDMRSIENIPDGCISSGKIIFTKGRFFCMVQSENFDTGTEKELVYICSKIKNIQAKEKTTVNVDSYLPVDKRVKYSEKYFVGQIGLKSEMYIGEDDVIPLSPMMPGYFTKYEFSGKRISILVLPMEQKRGARVNESLHRIFEDRYELQGKLDGINYYADKRGYFYFSKYQGDRLVVMYRAEEKRGIEEILKRMG